jgi:hypothetical protein
MSDATDISVDWRARAEAAEARVAELAEERARLWEENNRLRATQREVEYYEKLAKDMQGSVSWQITSPLRSAKKFNVWVRWKLKQRRES